MEYDHSAVLAEKLKPNVYPAHLSAKTITSLTIFWNQVYLWLQTYYWLLNPVQEKKQSNEECWPNCHYVFTLLVRFSNTVKTCHKGLLKKKTKNW